MQNPLLFGKGIDELQDFVFFTLSFCWFFLLALFVNSFSSSRSVFVRTYSSLCRKCICKVNSCRKYLNLVLHNMSMNELAYIMARSKYEYLAVNFAIIMLDIFMSSFFKFHDCFACTFYLLCTVRWFSVNRACHPAAIFRATIMVHGPTNNISIEFEIQINFVLLFFVTYSADHNIFHMSWQ